MLSCVEICVGLLVTILVTVWYVLKSRYYQLGFKIPGPPGLPLLGNILEVLQHRYDFMEYVKTLQAKYAPVCRGWVGPHLLVGVIDPTDIAVIFNSSRTLSKPMVYRPVAIVFGKSLLTAENEEWKKFRKLLNPTFVPKVIDTYISAFYKKSLVMADLLEKHVNGQPFDISNYTMMCTLDMVSETSLGVPTDIQGKDKQHSVIVNFKQILEILSHMMVQPWLHFVCIAKFTRLYRVVFALSESIREYVFLILKEKINGNVSAIKTGTGRKEGTLIASISSQKLGFLDKMTSTLLNNPGLFTAEELRDQAMLVMGAATDTSAYTVAHTLMLLGLHQDVQRKVMQEQEDIFGEDMNRPITAADLKKMVYLEQVINESMRLYPIVPFVGRRVDEEVTVSGYTLPSGTSVLIPIFLAHRDPKYYPDPEVFDPDRFNKENTSNRPACSFIPFASGPRMCIGKDYAYKAMKIMLSVVIRRYKVLRSGSRDDMEKLVFNFLTKMVNGYNIKLQLR